MANTLGVEQPFRYRGYVYDNETGFYYLQSRYYDPNTCRFISADVLLSTGQGVLGHNSFAYCLNDPVNNNDLQGFRTNRNNGYDSLDDALKAASKKLNEMTAKTNIEYGFLIYCDGGKYYLSGIIRGNHAGIDFKNYYQLYKKEGKKLEVAIHSHPSCYAQKNENPSKADRDFKDKFGIDLYLLTPMGWLKRCDKYSITGVNRFDYTIVDPIAPKLCNHLLTHYMNGRHNRICFYINCFC